MVSRREWARVGVLTAALVAVVNVPYVLAYFAPPSHVFTGILIALQDGHSYLAKIREGWRGEWLFTLPYTPDPGPGAFIFTYYLFLGHLARWLGLSVEVIYHLARILNSAIFGIVAYHFIAHFFERGRVRLAIWLAFFGSSGLGWLFVLSGLTRGALTADLWVTESIPFLTIFGNAHFPLAWALMLLIYAWAFPPLVGPLSQTRRLTRLALGTTALAQVQPMMLLPIGVIVGGVTLWQMYKRRLFVLADWWPVVTIGLFAAPWVGYAVWVTQALPVFREWNAQNATPSPPVWEALIWGGVPLVLALPGVWLAARRRSPLDVVLLIWLGLGVVLLYAPFALQRRMSLGLWMPLVLLAASGVQNVIWPRLAPRVKPLVVGAIALFAAPSNLLVYLAALGAVLGRSPDLFITSAEAATIAQLPAGAIVLASPEISMLIPGRSDARVVYGHQFETINATTQEQAVLDFYAGRIAPEALFAAHHVDNVFYGPREAKLGSRPDLSGWRVIFQQGDVTIYGQ